MAHETICWFQKDKGLMMTLYLAPSMPCNNDYKQISTTLKLSPAFVLLNYITVSIILSHNKFLFYSPGSQASLP